MKKIISLIMVSFALALVMTMTAMAAGTATASANKTSASIGDEVTITYTVANADPQKSGGIAITIGDGLEFVSGEMLFTDASINQYNTSKNQGAFMYTTATDVNKPMAKVVVKLVESEKVVGARTVSAKITLKDTKEEIDLSTTINLAPTGINVDKESVAINLAGQTTTDTVTATIAPQGATGTIKATSSDTNVATVTDAGVIEGKKVGTATVTFKVDGTNITKTVAVTVTCSHNPQNTVDAKYLKTAGNCVEKAVYYQNCSVCGEKLNTTFEGELDPNTHKGPINTVGAKTATHFEDGYTGDKVCSACQTTTEKGQTITKGAHTWSTTYETNETQHWQKCTSDDATTEKANHTAGAWETVEEAAIGKAGKKVQKCTVCGYVMATEDIPALIDYTDTKTAEYKEEAPADVVINTKKQDAAVNPTGITVGEKSLREGTDYTVDGNKITIKKDAVKDLPTGSYDVTVTYPNGTAKVALTVTRATPVETTPETTPATQASNVPATGIESHIGLWIALLVLAAAGIAVFSFRKKESK